MLMLLFLLVTGLVLSILYLKNLQELLKECSFKNQQIAPGNVWLMFIPVFSIFFQFYLYPKISESIKREFEERDDPQSVDYLRELGIALALLSLTSFITQFIPEILLLTLLVALANIILFIIYWTKAADFKMKLRYTKSKKGVRISENPEILD